MALPVYLQQFKAAGIYRVVYDQSTVRGVEAETLRLVVGYSEQGPFNIPTYVKSVSEFKALYGNINKNLERRGVFFHRLAIQALAAGPILCLNLKKFNNEQVQYCAIGSGADAPNNPLATPEPENAAVTSIYDTSGFWELSEENVSALSKTKKNYINICAADTIKNSNTFFIRKAIASNVKGYDITVSDWYSDESEIPEFLKEHLDAKISDFIAEVYVFGGQFTKEQISASSVLDKYFDPEAESPTLRPEVIDAWGDNQDTLEMLYKEDTAKPIGHYVGSLIPEFKDKNGNYMALNIVFNQDENVHNMIMSFYTDLLYDNADAYNNIVLPETIENKMPKPVYLKGYTYTTDKITDLDTKIKWHKSILKTLTKYKGLRRALLNKSNIDFRYIVDTFEAYPETGTSSDIAEQDTTKSMLSYLAKQKESALAILNFPSVRNFVKSSDTSDTYLTNNVFDINKVVNKYKLPSNAEGASFCAFYTPVKFTDGYIDTIVPSAGLVSNLFMQKYTSRQPYYIIAGPNYGLISSNGLVGPDYNYSNDELQIIEPFGVNCMIYRPGFGTFINANQTAKQTPVSALSKVHVRELVIYLQDEIEKVLQSYQWEFNNTTTRNAILDKANQICARVAANGGIQAYLNVMDESNNTPDVIDNEMAILSTHIEPGRGCGKMIQELTIYRTGELSSTITE